MAFMSSETENNFPYSSAACFSAMIAAAESLPKFKIKNANEAAGMIQLSVSAGMTSFTWGDIVAVTLVSNTDGTTKVSITSTAKAPSVLASVQQSKNIQAIVDAFTTQLENYTQVAPATASTSSGSAKDRLASLSDLRANELISAEEYEKKRADILAAL